LSLLRRELSANVVLLQFADLFPKNCLQLANALLENADPLVQLQEDSILDSSLDDQVQNMHFGTCLAEAVHASDPLLNYHWVPREIVIDKVVAKLKIQALAADLCRNQYLDVGVGAKSVHYLAPFILLRVLWV